MQALRLKNFSNLNGKSFSLTNLVRCHHQNGQNIYFLTKPNPDETVKHFIHIIMYEPHPFLIIESLTCRNLTKS